MLKTRDLKDVLKDVLLAAANFAGLCIYCFYLGFLSRTFTIHETRGRLLL